MAEGLLFLSANHGHYAIADDEAGPDLLVDGTRIEICIGGRWIPGRVKYDPDPIYTTPGPQAFAEIPLMASRARGIAGYYFVAATGEICGLCMGMQVRSKA